VTSQEKAFQAFAQFAANLKGDEKSEAQTFLFHLPRSVRRIGSPKAAEANSLAEIRCRSYRSTGNYDRH